jgi:serine/threonine protein kinase
MVKNPWNDETNDNIKIIDFGLSRVLGKEEMSLDPYGSLCFKAPELIQHVPYSFKVDVWAIGVTIYYLMFGCLPFEKGSKNDIKKSIMEANLTFPVGKTNYIHDDDSKNNSNYDALLYAMICDCLEKIPNKRSTINILISKYIDTFQDDDL